MQEILEKIFDDFLSPTVWKEVGGGECEKFSTREQLKEKVVNRAYARGVTTSEFRQQMKKDVAELKKVIKKK